MHILCITWVKISSKRESATQALASGVAPSGIGLLFNRFRVDASACPSIPRFAPRVFLFDAFGVGEGGDGWSRSGGPRVIQFLAVGIAVGVGVPCR